MASALAHRPAPTHDVSPVDLQPFDPDHLAPVIPLRPRPAPTPRQVFWRRRAVVGLVVVALAVAVLAVFGSPTAVAPATPAAVATVTLQPGDTLWDVAVGATPAGGDPRVMLERIRALNGFDGDVVPAWTVVVLPTP
jgi:hypothetical protein